MKLDLPAKRRSMPPSALQFLCFSVVGTIGFVIDATLLLFSVEIYGLDPYSGRVVSYLAAATATWKLNRTFTFVSSSSKRLHHEWAHYVSINAIGGGVNYAVYALCVLCLAIVKDNLILGVAVGSLAGLAFNFTMSKAWVFRDTQQS